MANIKADDIDKLVTAYEKNYLLREAAEAVEVSECAALRYLKLNGAYKKNAEISVIRRERELEKIKKFCADGKKGRKEIAKFLNCSVTKIDKIVLIDDMKNYIKGNKKAKD